MWSGFDKMISNEIIMLLKCLMGEFPTSPGAVVSSHLQTLLSIARWLYSTLEYKEQDME